MTTTPFISKSKYLNGLQCHKLLWHYYNAKDEIPPTDAATQAIFDQGHVVGEYAKKLYPTGIEVAKGIIDFQKVIEQTQLLIAKRLPLFEPAFRYKNAYARPDILNPVGKNAWEIVEVKSSTKVKEVNLEDLSLQWYTYEGAGLDIKRCYLLRINNRYVRNGAIDVRNLFIQEDVTSDVKKLLPRVQQNLDAMVRTIAAEKYPETEIGLHCSDPYPCPLHDKCFGFLPAHNPLTLYRYTKKKAYSLIHGGVTDILNIDILNIDNGVKLNDNQRTQIGSVRAMKEHIDKEGIRSFLKKLKYPLYYLDFETIGPAIPLFDQSRPYEQIPFQFSLHIQASPGGATEHIGYLAEGKDDPRPEFLRLLRTHLADKGSIVIYNASFEKKILKMACEGYPEYSKWNDGIKKRIVDLLKPFQAFYYYHYNQQGSASIKSVLPALTGKGYEGMKIAEGGTASNEFLRITFGEGGTAEERTAVRNDLEEYCKLDTTAMVEIVERLMVLVKD